MAGGDSNGLVTLDILAFLRAVTGDRNERSSALRRVGVYLGKWLLAGGAVAMVMALGESRAIGCRMAWRAYGFWWVVIAATIAGLPVAILFIHGLAEFVLLGLATLSLRLFGPTGIRRIAGLVLIGVALFVAVYLFATAEDVARTEAAHPAIPLGGAPAVPTERHDWDLFDWLRSNMVILAIGALVWKTVETTVTTWVQRRLSRPEAPTQTPQTTLLYGADGRVVSEVPIEAPARPDVSPMPR